MATYFSVLAMVIALGATGCFAPAQPSPLATATPDILATIGAAVDAALGPTASPVTSPTLEPPTTEASNSTLTRPSPDTGVSNTGVQWVQYLHHRDRENAAWCSDPGNFSIKLPFGWDVIERSCNYFHAIDPAGSGFTYVTQIHLPDNHWESQTQLALEAETFPVGEFEHNTQSGSMGGTVLTNNFVEYQGLPAVYVVTDLPAGQVNDNCPLQAHTYVFTLPTWDQGDRFLFVFDVFRCTDRPEESAKFDLLIQSFQLDPSS